MILYHFSNLQYFVHHFITLMPSFLLRFAISRYRVYSKFVCNFRRSLEWGEKKMIMGIAFKMQCSFNFDSPQENILKFK